MTASKNLINGMKPEFGNLDQIKILQKEENDLREQQEAEDWKKNATPGELWFDAFLNVDWTMGYLQTKIKEFEKFFGGRNPIEVMIDKVTGYDKSKIKAFLLILKEAYEELIKNFKIMEDDRAELYEGLLKKINEDLKGEYKKVKAT